MTSPSVLVAVPFMVRPVLPVPPPMVEDALERNPARSGLPEKTRLPAVPVSSLTSMASSALVSIEVEETLPLKDAQSVVERHPCIEPLAVSQVSTPAEFKSPIPVRLVNGELLITSVVVVAISEVRLVIVEEELLIIPPVKVRRLEAESAWSDRRNDVVAIPANV